MMKNRYQQKINSLLYPGIVGVGIVGIGTIFRIPAVILAVLATIAFLIILEAVKTRS